MLIPGQVTVECLRISEVCFVCAAEGEKRQEYQKDCVRLSSLCSAGSFSEVILMQPLD